MTMTPRVSYHKSSLRIRSSKVICLRISANDREIRYLSNKVALDLKVRHSTFSIATFIPHRK
jgi:hypothetical protein